MWKQKNANLNFVRLKKIDKKPNTNAPESMTNDRSNCRKCFCKSPATWSKCTKYYKMSLLFTSFRKMMMMMIIILWKLKDSQLEEHLGVIQH